MNKIFKLFLSIATLVLVSTSFAYAEEFRWERGL